MPEGGSVDVDVAVVGGGPVGLTLAMELGRRGRRVGLVERQSEVHRIPKGQNLTNRSLEIMHFLGAEEELRRSRMLASDVTIGGVTAYDSLTSEHWHASEGAPGRGAEVAQYFFRANDRMPQYVTERVLRNRLADFPDVTASFGWEAIDLRQDSESATLRIQGGDGEARTLRASFVVGCDGAHSFVREQAGIASSRDDFERVMVLAVFRSSDLHQILGHMPVRTTYRVIRQGLDGYWEFFGRVDNDTEWFFHAPVGEAGQRADVDVAEVMRRAVGQPFDIEMLHVGYWNLRISIADEYSSGRVLIAGDAAHSHPPYGGFGLNSGLEDASNLGWKLDGALAGWGGPHLLDSYGQERRPVFVGIRDLIVDGVEVDRRFVERADPLRGQSAFDEAWAAHPKSANWHYVPHYSASPIVWSDEPSPSGVDGELSFAARAGNHLPPCRLSVGTDVYEHLPRGFALLALDADERDVERFVQAARELNVPLEIVRDDATGPRSRYRAALILVRPDQYVAWAADQVDDPENILRTATGHGPTESSPRP